MVKFKKFNDFYKLLEELKEDNLQFKIYGQSKEYFTGVLSDNNPPNNYRVTLVAMTSLGTFYCSERLNINDQEQISQVKALLNTLSIAEIDISFKDGTVYLG